TTATKTVEAPVVKEARRTVEVAAEKVTETPAVKEARKIAEPAKDKAAAVAAEIAAVGAELNKFLAEKTGDITLEEAQEFMTRFGWGLISINTIMGNFNTVILANRKKSPTYLANSLWVFGTAPLLLFDYSI